MDRFCTQCGTQVNDSDKFCYKCGMRFNTRREKGINEPVLLVTGGALKQGFVKQKMITLLITEKRLAIVRYDKDLMAQIARQVADEAKSQNIGLLKRFTAQFKVTQLYYDRYLGQDVNQSIAEHSDNFYIINSSISSVKLRLGGHKIVNRETMSKVSTRIDLVASSTKYRVVIKDERINNDLCNIMQRLFGNILKITRA